MIVYGLTGMQLLAFASHIVAGALFILLGYDAHGSPSRVWPWIIPLVFAAGIITADLIAAFRFGITIGYTGIVLQAVGAIIGAGASLALFKPHKNQAGGTASSEFKI